jgi:hypothetical protein
MFPTKNTPKKVISTSLLALFFLLSMPTFSQPVALWAKSGSSIGNETTHSIVSDAQGNIYIAGTFTDDTLQFGTVTLSNINNQGSAFYLVKFNSSGNAVWGISSKGTLYEEGTSICIDLSGNIFITGYFDSNILNLDTVSLNNTSSPSTDCFIAKYDSSGNIQWAKSIAGNSYDYPRVIKTDDVGNIYLVGYFQSDSISIGSETLLNPGTIGYEHTFIAKYNSSGSVIWAKTCSGGSNSDYTTAMDVDSSGNVFIAGLFGSDTFGFDTLTVSNALPGAQTYDVFYAKFDSSGNTVWLKRFGGDSFESANSLVLDNNSNIILTGSFYSNKLIIGSDTLVNTDVSLSTTEIYLAKFDSNGNPIWAKASAGSDYDESYAIAVDNIGDIYICGYFNSSTMNLDNISLVNPNGLFNSEIYLAKYHSSGSISWAQRAGGSGLESGNVINIDINGDVIIAGYFDSPAITFDAIVLPNTGANDAFLVKFSSTVGIAEHLHSKNEINIYPNPTHGKLCIGLPSSQTSCDLEIYNELGKLVFSQKEYNSNEQINLLSTASGFYLIKCIHKGSLIGSKVITLE